jgi:hypothetical protein
LLNVSHLFHINKGSSNQLHLGKKLGLLAEMSSGQHASTVIQKDTDSLAAAYWGNLVTPMGEASPMLMRLFLAFFDFARAHKIQHPCLHTILQRA